MKKEEMIPLTNEENKSYKTQKVCYICKKGFSTDDDIKGIIKSEFIVTTQENIEELLIVFDCHFIIKELAKEFESQFEWLGENTDKYIIFSVPIKTELDNGKTITYKLKFIDSFRFMSTSL